MFLLFLNVALLRISVSLSTDKNVPIKAQLQRSLSHVNDMLADIEGKIDKERRLLSQIDVDLNKKEADYMETVTEIWWDNSQLTEVPNVTEPTPTLFGETTDTTAASHPPNWPFPTEYGTANTTKQGSMIINDLKSSMAVDGIGYGSAFVVKFVELLLKKDFLTSTEFFNTFSEELNKRIDEGKLASIGQDVLESAKMSVVMIRTFGLNSPTAIDALSKTQLILKNKNIQIDADIREAIDIYDNMFTKEEGEELFASLELFERYPDGVKTGKEVCEVMLNAFQAPYKRNEGTWEQKKLVRLIHQATQNALRMGRPAFPGPNTTDRPERRSMNYKKIVQHLLHKHPRILKKLNERHKDKRIRRHRRDSRDYHDYDETRSQKYKSHRFRQRAVSDRSNEPDRDNTESIFYHDHHVNDVSTTRKKVMHQIRRRNRMKRRKHRRERRKHRRHRKRKHRHRLSTTSHSTIANATTSITSSSITPTSPTIKTTPSAAAKKLVSGLSPEYLKQLAISYFRKKQEIQNFRRFNIPSSDGEIYGTSDYSSNSTEHNNLLQKIIEDTSYSDEEDHLKNNLYDALRHDNRTLVKFRAIHDEEDMNDTVRDTSKETDNEWVLKNNIYKAIEKKNQVYRK